MCLALMSPMLLKEVTVSLMQVNRVSRISLGAEMIHRSLMNCSLVMLGCPTLEHVMSGCRIVNRPQVPLVEVPLVKATVIDTALVQRLAVMLHRRGTLHVATEVLSASEAACMSTADVAATEATSTETVATAPHTVATTTAHAMAAATTAAVPAPSMSRRQSLCIESGSTHCNTSSPTDCKTHHSLPQPQGTDHKERANGRDLLPRFYAYGQR